MTFAVSKQVVMNNRVYDLESLTIKNGQAYADGTYKVHGVVHQVECDDTRIMLAKKVRN